MYLPCKTLLLLPDEARPRLGTVLSAHLLAVGVGDLQVLPCLQLDSASLAARHPLKLSSRLQIAGDLHLQKAAIYEQPLCTHCSSRDWR